MKRIEPFTKEWYHAAYKVMKCHVSLHDCVSCGGPVVKGYQCLRCGSDPDFKRDVSEIKEWDYKDD